MTITHLPPIPASLSASADQDTPTSNAETGTARTVRRLSGNEFTAVAVVAALVGALALLGFINSFTAVMAAARPAFKGLAWSVPLGIDVGIGVFAALDIVLARLNMRLRWLRLIPWTLTAATIYLNVSSEPTAFGRIAHAVLPALWVIAVEVGSHVVRIRAGIEAGTRMDSIRASRWVLAPWPTFKLWRRMVLWEVRSYTDALARERNRVLALTDLQDTYGRRWRSRAPRRVRALYRLGELTPATLTPAGTVPQTPPGPSAVPSGTAEATTPVRSASRSAGRSVSKPGTKTGTGPRKGSRSRTPVPDVDDLMPLGWHIAADLEAARLPLKRDTLAAALRTAGQSASSARVGALLARLKTEAPTDPNEIPAVAPVESGAAEGDL